MHPAFSVIFFTTASGAGYGLLALLGVGAALGLLPPDRLFGVIAFALSFGLITAGLLSSTFHLGHPERAWRALTQWRSSWLSREGVLAIATYVPAGLFAIGWVFLADNRGVWAWLGVASAGLAALTVICTAMIYASLRTIHQWCNGWVVPNYVALALMTGALWLGALMQALGVVGAWVGWLALCAIALAALVKLAYWRFIDTSAAVSTAESATGLGALGPVRMLDPPHTQENYLQREMGFRIARKHATKLRASVVLLGFAVPAALTALALLGNAPPVIAIAASALAALSASVGVVVERWLFFAEAKHVVTLYYGAHKA
ncbi:MAG: dimethyl sulfoxide reductase anchor subunit [Alphaproteobacteria bacterium]|nr:dimethyl sulfoxide reductase anchor subunit [Alphaproteobacteria bacterium]